MAPRCGMNVWGEGYAGPMWGGGWAWGEGIILCPTW